MFFAVSPEHYVNLDLVERVVFTCPTEGPDGMALLQFCMNGMDHLDRQDVVELDGKAAEEVWASWVALHGDVLQTIRETKEEAKRRERIKVNCPGCGMTILVP